MEGIVIFKEFLRCRGGGWLDSRFVLKGTEPQYAPDRTFDTEHIKLDFDLDLPRKSLRGTCATTLRALQEGASEMVFDAVNFRLISASHLGRPLKYKYDGRKL